jgi:tetratricopeptide (TPR) repeat protein
MVEDPLAPEPSPQDTLLQDAIAAIRRGEYAPARDMLMRLLRTDQNNANYWVWLSAAMETQQERLYCLQTALKIDPSNAAAKRGLIMAGALAPDDSLPPFPMDHPRPWEEKIVLAGETPKPKGFKGFIANPAVRLIGVLLIGALVVGGLIYGFTQSSKLFPARPRRTGSTATFTPTVTKLPSATPLFRTATPTFIGPTPLYLLLQATYTPTPLYAATPHSGASGDTYRVVVQSYGSGDWAMVRLMMEQIATAEPGAADALYFIGETYRLEGRYTEALDAFQEAIKLFPNFAPNFVGRALTKKAINPKNNVIADLDTAIRLDPNYAEAYLLRALYYINDKKYELARADLKSAETSTPFSPLVQLYLAQVDLALGNNEQALAEAQKANELDMTILEGYRLLGLAYQANDQIDQAVGAFQTYTLYNPTDADAFMFLGSAYYHDGNYALAIETLNKAIGLDDRSSQAHYWRGEAYYAQQDYIQAEADFRAALKWNSGSFEAGLGIGKALFAQGHPNNAYIALNNAEKNIQNDSQYAEFYYWSALSLEQMQLEDSAYNNWRKLLALSASAMTAEMRATAEEHLAGLRTPTPSLTSPPSETPTMTLTPSSTPAPSGTP